LKPLHNARRIDLSKYVTNMRRNSADPLAPEWFLKTHKKEERRAKQIRNSEREKAQHEKVQLERLLDELRGPDWLRTMGISGITETEKKKYEPKRKLFTEEIKTMIDKFRQFKELEKEQKKKEQETPAEEEDVEEQDDPEEADEDDDEEHVQSSPIVSPGGYIPDSSDVDALAARQLLQEANSAQKPRKKVVEPPLPPPEPPPHKPFTSFYDKRHVRDAAIGKHGRRSRGVSAFGQPVPELEEKEFELPNSILTDDAIRAGQRRRRRFNREIE
jgi:Something about silencing, SAS, complex subunit 4